MADPLKVMLLCNIGNRDLLFKGAEIRPARTSGKEIADNLSTCQDDLSLPILWPVIQTIEAEAPDSPIDLILFCTDQQGVPERFRENDTRYFGECIQQLLRGQAPVARLTPRWIPRNPALYDSMFAFFKEEMSRLPGSPAAFRHVFVSLAGGIPACNMALCLQALQTFGEKCVPLYPLEGREHVVPLQIGVQLLTSSKRALVRQLIGNYEYGAAGMILESIDMPLQASLAQLAMYRLNFDFQRAQQWATSVITKDLSEVRAYALVVSENLQRLQQERLPYLIRELYWNAGIKFRKGEYLDFLGRLFRFQEAALRYAVENSALGLTTAIDPHQGLKLIVR